MERALKHSFFKSFVLLFCLLGFIQSSFATTAIVPLDDDLIIGARAIVRGKVLSVSSALDNTDNRIYTYVTLRVQEVLKGHILDHKIVLKELGGIVGDRNFTVFGNAQFTVDERVVVYLDTWADGSLRAHQMFLGKFSIIRDHKTGQSIVVRNKPDSNTTILNNLSGHQHSGGAITNQMELGAYTAMVRRRLEANQSRAEEFEAAHYSSVPLLAAPPEYSRIESSGELHPQFAIFPTPMRWFEPDTGQPVIAMVKPDGWLDPPATTIADMTAAMNAWSNVTGSALRVVNGGTLTDCYTITNLTGIGLVFDNCDGRNAASSGCAGILAWGGFSAGGGQVRVINGTTFSQARQGFVSFNPWAECNYGFDRSCRIREVATHEIGHALGLGHSEFGDATMAAFAHFDGRCASIRSDDENGIRFIYPGTGGGGGALSIVSTSPLVNAVVGTVYSQSLVASGGTTPYTWSVTGGALPGGLSLSSGGTISGTPGAVGTFNFTVRVADNANPQATAQRDFSLTVSGVTAPDSQFVSQSVPATLTPGQSFNVNLRWLNTGSQAWTAAGGFKVISQNPANNVVWGGNTVLLTGLNILPGQQLDLSFTAFAPSTPGTYNFQWQLFKDGSGFFGQMSPNVSIQVGSGGGGGTNDAAFVSQSVPATMNANESVNVSVTMRNSGTTTWAPGTYKLGSQNPQDNNTWGLNRVNLASPVAPDSNATFTFSATAPATAGAHNFQWRMLQEGVGYFGAVSTNVGVTVSAGGGGGGGGGGGTAFNAAMVSQSVPATMSPGLSYVVSIIMRNTGTSSWSSIGGFRLGSQNPQDNTTWGLSSVTLSKFVGPGSQFTFTFTVRAPSTPGTYNFQWRMSKSDIGYFGDASQNVAIQVGGGGGGGGTNDAAFVSQSVPATMTVGQSANVSITMRNSGSTTWAAGTYMLGSQNPQDNMTWGVNRVNLATPVAPGSDATFTFNVTAPATAAAYNFQWRMMQSGTGFFGVMSANVPVGVIGGGGGGGGTDDAMFMSQSVPSSLNTSQAASVSVTMKNMGTTTWSSAGGYYLGSQNPQGSSTWGTNRVNLPASVAPGSEVTFTFTATAPSNAGTHNFQWRMAKDGSGSFGVSSTNVAVNVTSGSALPLVITTASLANGQRFQPYNQQVNATGGVAPYTWSINPGGLPSGVSIDSSTGLISGVTTTGGSYNVTVTVRDQNGTTTSRTYKVLFR